MVATACLQCGTPSASNAATFCRRCGLPYGAPPRADVELPSCHVCYRTVDDDGRLPSMNLPGLRVDLHLDRLALAGLVLQVEVFLLQLAEPLQDRREMAFHERRVAVRNVEVDMV